MPLTIPPIPALNKQGYAKITFLGYQVITKNGGIKPYIKLEFEVADTTRKNPIKVNVFGRALVGSFLETVKALGFNPPTPTNDVDEDGFELDTTDPEETLNALLVHFLNKANAKTVLLGKLRKSDRNFWEIDTTTLRKPDKTRTPHKDKQQCKLTIYLEPEVKRAIRQLAAKQNRTMSNLVVTLLTEYSSKIRRNPSA